MVAEVQARQLAEQEAQADPVKNWVSRQVLETQAPLASTDPKEQERQLLAAGPLQVWQLVAQAVQVLPALKAFVRQWLQLSAASLQIRQRALQGLQPPPVRKVGF